MMRKTGGAVYVLLAVVVALVIIKVVFVKDRDILATLSLEDTADFFGDEEENKPRTICNPRQLLCDRKRDELFDGLHKIDAQELVHRVMTRMTFKCRNLVMFGVRGHGGYEACMDKSYAFEKKNCLVYSFGYSNGYSFEEAIINEYGCEVHTFDPNIQVSKEEEASMPNWTVHKIGIWGDDFENSDGSTMRRLATITSMLGHENRVIDLIKLDVQGGEWPFFRDISIHPGTLDNVKQFIFAAYAPRRKPRDQIMRMTDYSQVFRSVSFVKKLGFRNYLHHGTDMSQGCCRWWADLVPPVVTGTKVTICCYQTFMVNMNFL